MDRCAEDRALVTVRRISKLTDDERVFVHYYLVDRDEPGWGIYLGSVEITAGASS